MAYGDILQILSFPFLSSAASCCMTSAMIVSDEQGLGLEPTTTTMTAEALGLPFKCFAVAEKNKNYQETILLNNPSMSRANVYDSVEAVLHEIKDPESSLAREVSVQGVSLAVMGSPCNPYSTKRCKRFVDGDVANHSMNGTTQTSVVEMYKEFEPRIGITEQVKGFQMRTSTSEDSSPHDRRSMLSKRS